MLQVVELKPDGKKIPVTNENRVEYIHRMSDYLLNKRVRHPTDDVEIWLSLVYLLTSCFMQIRAQCDAFREGLSDVINMEWLRMFNHNELQVLISGASIPIDIADLRRNTNYAG